MQTTLKKIGNSYGIIFTQKLLAQAHISQNAPIVVDADGGGIRISLASNRRPVNRDLSTWRAQIKKAIKEGGKPGKSVWGNAPTTSFDENEWTW